MPTHFLRKATALLAFALCPSLATAQGLWDKSLLHEFRLTFASGNWWNNLNQGRQETASLVYNGVTYPQIGVTIKGNTSARVPGNKKPFNLSIDAFNSSLRLGGQKTINLNNGYVDPTFTREVLTYEILGNYMPVPRTTYIKVFINGGYWGLYIGIEQPNKDFLRQWYQDEDGVRFKGDPPSGAALRSATLRWRGAALSNYFNFYELKTPSLPQSWPLLVGAINQLNNAPPENFPPNVEPVIDIDRALWYIAVNNLTNNLDSYISGGHNYYMYFDPDDDRLDMLPWDCNMSFGVFGIFGGGGNSSATLNPFNESTSATLPLVSKLLTNPTYRQIYLAHYRTALNETYDWDGKIKASHDAYQALIQAAVQTDPNRLYSMTYFTSNLTQSVRVGGYTAPGLKTLVDQRRAWLLARADIGAPTPAISNVSFSPTRPRAGSDLWVLATVKGTPTIADVKLRYTSSGAYLDAQMYDDGLHRDGGAGDDVWGGSFKPSTPGEQYRFYVKATNTSKTVSLHPARAEHQFLSATVWNGQPAGPLSLNELVADNDSGDVDEVGEYEDWVEINNTSSTAYDLTGHYLSDDLEDPTKWGFPAGTMVMPGGFIRVWCDDQVTQGPLHASFKLAQSGEEVGLFDTTAAGNALLDAVIFPQQKADRAYGRVPDGSGDFVFVWEPSGAAPLQAPGRAAVRYDHRRTGSPSDLKLRFSGSTTPGQVASFDLTGGPASGGALLMFSGGPGYLDLTALGFGPLALNPAQLVMLPVALDPAGSANLAFPVPNGLAGQLIYCQALANDFSNALSLLL